MNIDIAFVDKWIMLELAAALSAEPAVGQPYGPPCKEMGFYALYFPQHDYLYFGEAGDLAFAKSNHLYRLWCNRHELKHVQDAYNDDPDRKVFFFSIQTRTRDAARALLEQFLRACKDQVKVLNWELPL